MKSWVSSKEPPLTSGRSSLRTGFIACLCTFCIVILCIVASCHCQSTPAGGKNGGKGLGCRKVILMNQLSLVVKMTNVKNQMGWGGYGHYARISLRTMHIVYLTFKQTLPYGLSCTVLLWVHTHTHAHNPHIHTHSLPLSFSVPTRPTPPPHAQNTNRQNGVCQLTGFCQHALSNLTPSDADQMCGMDLCDIICYGLRKLP